MKAQVGRPPGHCTICRHQERHRIELAAVSGASRNAIGKKFSVSADAVGRHLNNHVSQERRAQLVAGPLRLHELAAKAAEADLSLVDYLGMLRSSLFEQFLAAGEVGDRQGMQGLAGRLVEVLRLQGSVSGEISKATATITNNTLILTSPLFADLQTMLLRTLSPYPEALDAVVAGLEDLDRKARGSTAPLDRAALEHSA